MRARFLIKVALGDLLSLGTAVAISSWVLLGDPNPWQGFSRYGNITPVLGSLVLGMALASYVTARSFGNGVPRPSYGRALWIALLTFAFIAVFIVMARPDWSRGLLGWTFLTWTGLMLAHRTVGRRRPWSEAMVLITAEKGLADDLEAAPHAQVLEVLDPSGRSPDGPPAQDTTMVVDLHSVLSDEMARFVSSLSLAGYHMRALGSVYEEHTGRLPIVHLNEGWELTVPIGRRGIYDQAKQLVDAALVLLVSPLALLLGAGIALAIRLDSEGPALFRQERVGRHGEIFTMYKFRTMVLHEEDSAPPFATRGDRRLTRMGRLLRRFRADELPQLWNVLKGDVSLVGPRPEWKRLADRYAETVPFYTYRHLVRPGITGWAQVNFGYADSEADVIEKLSYDLYYVKHMSPWLDMRVLGGSVWTVLSGFGAQ